jgi:hypothetical protein
MKLKWFFQSCNIRKQAGEDLKYYSSKSSIHKIFREENFDVKFRKTKKWYRQESNLDLKFSPYNEL